LVKRVLMAQAPSVNTCFPYFGSFCAFSPKNAKAAPQRDGFRLQYFKYRDYCASAATCILTI
jgi:hypothetical protein